MTNREGQATSVGAWATSLVAVYETDPEIIAAVLPPPIEPSDHPLVTVKVAGMISTLPWASVRVSPCTVYSEAPT